MAEGYQTTRAGIGAWFLALTELGFVYALDALVAPRADELAFAAAGTAVVFAGATGVASLKPRARRLPTNCPLLNRANAHSGLELIDERVVVRLEAIELNLGPSPP